MLKSRRGALSNFIHSKLRRDDTDDDLSSAFANLNGPSKNSKAPAQKFNPRFEEVISSFKFPAWVHNVAFEQSTRCIAWNVKSDDDDDDDDDNEAISCSLTIPSSGSSNFECVVGTDFFEIKASSIESALSQVFDRIERDLLTDDGDNDEEEEEEEEEEIEVEIDTEETNAWLSVSNSDLYSFSIRQLESDIAAIQGVPGWFAEIFWAGSKTAKLALHIDPRNRLKISPLVANAWSIDLDKHIVVVLNFSAHYTDSLTPPPVETFQSNVNESSGTLIDNPTPFGLSWTLQQRIQDRFFKKVWNLLHHQRQKFDEAYLSRKQKEKCFNWIWALMEFIEDFIRNSNKQCLVCGNAVPYQGLKPTTCINALCQFSHEQYGLGVDLLSEISNHPDIVDLMITMCSAAAHNEGRVTPFPEHLEVKKWNATTDSLDIHNFLTPSQQPDYFKILTILDKIPPLSDMQQWVSFGPAYVKQKFDEIDVLAYPLVRWILASYRCHLKKLEPDERIKEMSTPHQYVLLSASPEREKAFQDLNKTYGSVFAFHGSPISNWFSILRRGLKNMSGTSHQLNGAAYGSGIYLATSSDISFGYAHFGEGWRNSAFGTTNHLTCLAMCEVINHPSLKGQPNPFYVVPNEELVMTRYFFVYHQNEGNSSVLAKSIKPPKIRNS